MDEQIIDDGYGRWINGWVDGWVNRQSSFCHLDKIKLKNILGKLSLLVLLRTTLESRHSEHLPFS